MKSAAVRLGISGLLNYERCGYGINGFLLFVFKKYCLVELSFGRLRTADFDICGIFGVILCV